MNSEVNNQAFVDGQNLYLGTVQVKLPWRVDLLRFREYLYRRYKVSMAYYFLGFYDEKLKALYRDIFESGYKLVFRAYKTGSSSAKKGNVDTDIVFMMMRSFCEERNTGKLFLVSGDGDYFKMAKYLLRKGKLGKILFPARNRASSLYKEFSVVNKDYLDRNEIRAKIELSKKTALLR